MFRQSPGGTFRTAAIVVLALGLLPALASAQVVVKVNDNVNFRFGLQLQGWADWTQDANSEGYSQNMFLRRIRFILAANVAPGVSIFYQTDNPRAGNAGADGNKIINTGFLTQDAFVEWKILGDALMADGGLYLVPTSRNGLTSTQSFLAFDLGTWALQSNTLEKGNGGRDYGFGLKGYLVGDHLEYRAAVFSGNRFGTTPQTAPLGPAAGSRNSFRLAGRLQYDFFDTEKGYVYAGTFRGTKKIVAVGTWGDTQGDFRAFGGDFVVDWPIGKDAIKAEVDIDHFDGGRAFVATLPEQNDVYADIGYYFDVIKLQPFGVYQSLNFTTDATKGRDQERYGGGLNWYISGQNLKLSVLWERIVPKTKPVTAKIKDTNHIAVQLQAVYF
jgi:hypothetical protein